MELKSRKAYGKLIYKADANSDKIFYPFLIDLEEKFFVKYFAYSKFFLLQDSERTKEAQEHAKMLSSLFRLIFAKQRERVIVNHETYSFLTEYKKISFRVKPLHGDYKKSITVLDEMALNIVNDKVAFYDYLL